jgi:hypothetical protein
MLNTYPTGVVFFQRSLVLVLTMLLGLQWCTPLVSHAQSNGTSANISAGGDDLPPIQEVETIEVRKPFYKTWWFWTIAGVLVAGAAIAVAAGSGGSSSSSSPSGSPGNVQVKW